jgi:DNA-binding transcriptional LysR family regulator
MSRSFDPVLLSSIELFCKAAELGNFTTAAEAMGVTPAAVSRSVGRLENRLGLRLFVRTTRRVALTDDGRVYFEQCREALAQIELAERAITEHQVVPSGVLRISVPTAYGHYRVLPVLPKFTARYPLIKIDIHISNRIIDFVEEGYDLAIRMGEQQDSRLIARKLEDAPLGVFASPAYLKRRGVPKNLEELQQHDCIQFILPSTGRPMAWIFRNDGVDVDFAFESQVRVQQDLLGCVTYARAGGGCFQIYHHVARDDVVRGDLVEVLQAYGGRTRPFSIVYPQNRHLSAKVRAFVDFIAQEIRAATSSVDSVSNSKRD